MSNRKIINGYPTFNVTKAYDSLRDYILLCYFWEEPT